MFSNSQFFFYWKDEIFFIETFSRYFNSNYVLFSSNYQIRLILSIVLFPDWNKFSAGPIWMSGLNQPDPEVPASVSDTLWSQPSCSTIPGDLGGTCTLLELRCSLLARLTADSDLSSPLVEPDRDSLWDLLLAVRVSSCVLTWLWGSASNPDAINANTSEHLKSKVDFFFFFFALCGLKTCWVWGAPEKEAGRKVRRICWELTYLA